MARNRKKGRRKRKKERQAAAKNKSHVRSGATVGKSAWSRVFRRYRKNKMAYFYYTDGILDDVT